MKTFAALLLLATSALAALPRASSPVVTFRVRAANTAHTLRVNGQAVDLGRTLSTNLANGPFGIVSLEMEGRIVVVTNKPLSIVEIKLAP